MSENITKVTTETKSDIIYKNLKRRYDNKRSNT